MICVYCKFYFQCENYRLTQMLYVLSLFSSLQLSELLNFEFLSTLFIIINREIVVHIYKVGSFRICSNPREYFVSVSVKNKFADVSQECFCYLASPSRTPSAFSVSPSIFLFRKSIFSPKILVSPAWEGLSARGINPRMTYNPKY